MTTANNSGWHSNFSGTRIIYGVLCQVDFPINFISKIYLYDMVEYRDSAHILYIWEKWVCILSLHTHPKLMDNLRAAISGLWTLHGYIIFHSKFTILATAARGSFCSINAFGQYLCTTTFWWSYKVKSASVSGNRSFSKSGFPTLHYSINSEQEVEIGVKIAP